MTERVARERKAESGERKVESGKRKAENGKRKAESGVLMWLWWLEGLGRKKSRAGRRGISQ